MSYTLTNNHLFIHQRKTITKKITCETCHGEGHTTQMILGQSIPSVYLCDTCHGKGTIEAQIQVPLQSTQLRNHYEPTYSGFNPKQTEDEWEEDEENTLTPQQQEEEDTYNENMRLETLYRGWMLKERKRFFLWRRNYNRPKWYNQIHKKEK